MPLCESPLSRSLLGAKRTLRFAAHMSASEPKADVARLFPSAGLTRYDTCPEPRGQQ